MPLIYNTPEEGKKFGTLNPIYEKENWSWLTLAAQMEFDELRFAINDDFYFIYASCTKLTDFRNFKDIKAPWKEALVLLQVARKDYEVYSKAKGGKVPIAQSRLEKVVCKLIEALDPAKTYSGSLCLMDTNTLDQILSGVDKKGNQMSDELLASLLESCGEFEEVSEPTKIADADVVCPAQRKGGGGYGTTVNVQPESGKLADRMAFIKAQLTVVVPNSSLETISDMNNVLSDPGNGAAVSVYQMCLELMK